MNYFFSLFQTNTLHLTKTQSGSRIVHTMTLQREAEKGNKKSVIKILKKTTFTSLDVICLRTIRKDYKFVVLHSEVSEHWIRFSEAFCTLLVRC